MSQQPETFLCNTSDGTCPEHGRWLYYCGPCQERWAQANPERVAEIRKMADKVRGPLPRTDS